MTETMAAKNDQRPRPQMHRVRRLGKAFLGLLLGIVSALTIGLALLSCQRDKVSSADENKAVPGTPSYAAPPSELERDPALVGSWVGVTAKKEKLVFLKNGVLKFFNGSTQLQECRWYTSEGHLYYELLWKDDPDPPGVDPIISTRYEVNDGLVELEDMRSLSFEYEHSYKRVEGN